MDDITAEGVQIKVGDLKLATSFFRDTLGMEVEILDITTCVVNMPHNEPPLFISEKPLASQSDQIFIYTNDCIEQYCLLKAKGIVFTKAPAYCAKGLMAEFTDDFGNHYFLLEKRKYGEQI